MNINIWYTINSKILNSSIKMIGFEKWIKTFIIKTQIKTKALSAAIYNKNLAENAWINSEHYLIH